MNETCRTAREGRSQARRPIAVSQLPHTQVRRPSCKPCSTVAWLVAYSCLFLPQIHIGEQEPCIHYGHPSCRPWHRSNSPVIDLPERLGQSRTLRLVCYKLQLSPQNSPYDKVPPRGRSPVLCKCRCYIHRLSQNRLMHLPPHRT